MSYRGSARVVAGLCVVAAAGLGGLASAQTVAPINAAPDPYRAIYDWAKMPDGRTWGSTSGVDIDPDGASVWVAERCGAFAPPSQFKPGVPFACDGSPLDPILKFDATGKLVKSFGAGMFIFPHGLHVDRAGNVWVTDGMGRSGKGQQVFKFSPDGKVLLTLGKAGVAGDGPDEFNAPSAVYVAPDGDIFVADGHGGNTNARIVKFSPDGKFIKTWGKKGSAPGEFDIPHTLAMDARGRLFVGDRQNNRIQIFDQDGNFLDQWFQFSRPSGVYIDKHDVIYVADSESESVSKNHDGWKRGIRIGNVSDGVVRAFIPDPAEKATGTSAAEGVAADAAGNVYGAEVGPKRLVRYVKQ
jgi:DNA-binding beta-propeller fold protein YncE